MSEELPVWSNRKQELRVFEKGGRYGIADLWGEVGDHEEKFRRESRESVDCSGPQIPSSWSHQTAGVLRFV